MTSDLFQLALQKQKVVSSLLNLCFAVVAFIFIYSVYTQNKNQKKKGL